MSSVDTAVKAVGAVLEPSRDVVRGPAQQVEPSPTRYKGHRWAPGTSGNPKGRPAAGMALTEWYNELGIAGRYSVADLEGFAEGDDHMKAAAASTILGARKGRNPATDYSRSGIPLAANDLDRLHDRTVGKATQVVVVAKVEVQPMELSDEMRMLLAADPRLLEEVRGSVDAAALPLIEGEVVPEPGVGAQSEGS